MELKIETFDEIRVLGVCFSRDVKEMVIFAVRVSAKKRTGSFCKDVIFKIIVVSSGWRKHAIC